MTRRGRVTVALSAALLAALAGWAVWPDSSAPQRSPARSARAEPVRLPTDLLAPPVGRAELEALEPAGPGTRRRVAVPPGLALPGPLRISYSLRRDLSRRIWRVLDRGRVALAHVLVMDPRSGALLAYLSTDPERFPASRTYPAASLVKVVTAAAALDVAPDLAREHCRFVGSPYHFTRRRLEEPSRGREETLEQALATSNNQCFARWAVERVGSRGMLDALDRFGLLHPAGPGHASGLARDPGDDRFALGRLGAGLDGLLITPLHAVQLAATLVEGRRVAPHWITRVEDGRGRPLALPPPPPPASILTPALARQLRGMLAVTTVRGTARKAFRTRRGQPLLPGITVAGKTGSLSGHDPNGRYEWFIGVAPAEAPLVAIATVAVHGPLYWMSASQIAAEVLKQVFCPKGICSAEAARRFLGPAQLAAASTAPGG